MQFASRPWFTQSLGLLRTFAKKRAKKVKIIERTEYDLATAYSLLKAGANSFKDESIDVLVKLGVDPRRGDQTVRGTCEFPHNNGKKSVILFVCTNEENKAVALANGADLVINNDILEQVVDSDLQLKRNEVKFDKLYSTTEGLNMLKPFAKLLGPLGLFPNPKAETLFPGKDTGNLCAKIATIIQKAKRGKTEFRADQNAQILLPIARASFSYEVVEQNLRQLLADVAAKKPEKLKGTYFQKVMLKSTYGPYWRLHLPSIDPEQPLFKLKGVILEPSPQQGAAQSTN